ncbi:MAG: hypothetical protein Q7S36_01210 [Candidatus Liptonbacteria bacterium]|nr:hypothetical protein [Candidatus Liptonbacteria bacterium]
MLSRLGVGIKKPKILYWTAHARGKMFFYKLSEGRVKRLLHSPERVETGIAPETIAVMQTQKGPKNSYEIWAMVAEDKTRRKVISAWRYPGKTKPGEPLPAEILREFRACAVNNFSSKYSLEKSPSVLAFLEQRKEISKKMALVQKKWFKLRASNISQAKKSGRQPIKY